MQRFSDKDLRSPRQQLAPAPAGWLESMMSRLGEAAIDLSSAATADDVIRQAVVVAREKFGFTRVGTWFFEDGCDSAVGGFGVDENGCLTDERGLRIFDRTGFLSQMARVWRDPPYFFTQPSDALRSAEAKVLGYGSHVTAPLIRNGECRGFLAVDDLIETASVNDKTGYFLTAYASLVSSLYYQKQAEEQACQAEEACAQAERVKSEFLGMMSHEIRTPLNAIMGYAQLLGMNPTPENTKALARTIEESGDHLSELINGILEYAQLSGTDLKSWYKPVDPIALATSVVEAFRHSFEEKRVGLEFSHEGHLETQVMMDSVSFRQVLNNLLQNALKFTTRGKVRLTLQTQEKRRGETEVFVTVEDSGIGMEQEKLADIFKPFKQLDSSLTRKAGGIGMGLAIVERLVAAMGGRMDCRSQVGVGTVFSIDLVFENARQDGKDAAKPEPDVAIAAKAPREDLRMLVVEDDEQNMRVLLSMLEHLGYPQPETAENGAVAMGMLQQKPFDLVLLDVEMPEVDGLALTRSIRAGRCGPINRDVAIIGITAFTMEHDREQCLIAGMNEYIAKPVRMGLLEGALQRA